MRIAYCTAALVAGATACSAPEVMIDVHVLGVEQKPAIQIVSEGDTVIVQVRQRLTKLTVARAPAELSAHGGHGSTSRIGPGRHAVLIIPRGSGTTSGTVGLEAVIPSASHAPTLIGPQFRLWREWPIAVTSQGDSAFNSRIAAGVASLNEHLGDDLFRFDPEPERAATGALVEEAVLEGARLGSVELLEDLCTENSPALCSPRWLTDVRVLVDPRAGVSEIGHELLHVAGLDHTCVVESIMATHFDDAALSRCADARRGLGLRTPLRLERHLSPFDRAAVFLLREAAKALDGWRGASVIWIAA